MYEKSKTGDFIEVCSDMNIISNLPEYTKPKNVGLMFFSMEPDKFFPYTQIDVVQFPDGLGGNDIIEQTFKGPIHQQLRDALQYIRNTIITEKVVKHPDRAEADRFFNYPFAAVEEALSNAVYHRAYDEREPIEVRVEKDRIEIVSFPGPDRSVTIEGLKNYRVSNRRYRNRRIGDFLKELHLTEFYCKNWKGKNKQIKKRGFETKRAALEYERNYKIREEGDLDMPFGEFFKLYQEDMEVRLKHNTWLSKEHVVRTKILPFFKDMKMNEISPKDIVKWQNEMMSFKDEKGKSYSECYRKTMHNQLSCIFNHACRFYGLKENPARKAGSMGKEQSKEMLFWMKEEYNKFSEAIMDKPQAYYAFELLYWCGIRCGECLSLTIEDFNFVEGTLRINKSYQRLEGKDIITTPKTAKSNRVIKMPDFLVEEMQEYFSMLYGYKPTDRIFPFTKSFLHHEMDRGSRTAGVKRIRVHDLRHSHVSLLIQLGFSAVAIADRVGHESIVITYRYAHLFPSEQTAMADKLNLLEYARQTWLER